MTARPAHKRTLALAVTSLLLASSNIQAQYSVLHYFTGTSSDGAYPNGSLTLSGSTLYGMTVLGGSNNFGTAFQINSDGTGYTILHEFTGGGGGSQPYGSLTLSGSTLYGMASGGGGGVVFKINSDGTGFTSLHNFTGGSGDGAGPQGSLTLSGSTLYGMTRYGGAAAKAWCSRSIVTVLGTPSFTSSPASALTGPTRTTR